MQTKENIDLKKFQTLTTDNLMRTEEFTLQYSELGLVEMILMD